MIKNVSDRFHAKLFTVNNDGTEQISFSWTFGSTFGFKALLGISYWKRYFEDFRGLIFVKEAKILCPWKYVDECVSELFHSHLLYGTYPLWGNNVGPCKIFIWQKKALRITFDVPRIQAKAREKMFDQTANHDFAWHCFYNLLLLREINLVLLSVKIYIIIAQSIITILSFQQSGLVNLFEAIHFTDDFRELSTTELRNRLCYWLLDQSFYHVVVFLYKRKFWIFSYE